VGQNRFGHPTDEVLDRLKAQEIEYLRTDQVGEVKITTNGKKWIKKTQRSIF
jgi:beta-lactamase superfamily II metal-dependent hydrolase